MRLSTKGRYGLRIMVELAQSYGAAPVLVETIARNQQISSKYIHVLMSGLKTAGLVKAVRGPKGGFVMSKAPSSVTALDVVRIMEGEVSSLECVPNMASCPRSCRCAARELWVEVHQEVEKILGRATLEDLAARQKALLDEQLMYHI